MTVWFQNRRQTEKKRLAAMGADAPVEELQKYSYEPVAGAEEREDAEVAAASASRAASQASSTTTTTNAAAGSAAAAKAAGCSFRAQEESQPLGFLHGDGGAEHEHQRHHQQPEQHDLLERRHSQSAVAASGGTAAAELRHDGARAAGLAEALPSAGEQRAEQWKREAAVLAQRSRSASPAPSECGSAADLAPTLRSLRESLWTMRPATSSVASSSPSKRASPQPQPQAQQVQIKDLRALLDSHHALAPRLECASIDDVVASHRDSRTASPALAPALPGNNAIRNALESVGGLEGVLQRARAAKAPTHSTPPRDTASDRQKLDSLKASLARTARRSEFGRSRDDDMRSSISHGSIDDLLGDSRTASPEAADAAPAAIVEAIRSVNGSYSIRASPTSAQALLSDDVMRSDDSVPTPPPLRSSSPDIPLASFVTRTRADSEAVSAGAGSNESSGRRSLTSNVDLRVASPQTDRKHNERLLGLMRSSSQSSDEEENLSGMDLPSDEEASLRIIARRRAIKVAQRAPARPQAGVGAFSAKLAIKQQNQIRKAKGLKPLRSSLKSKVVQRSATKKKQLLLSLDLAAGRDRADSSSDEDAPLPPRNRLQRARKAVSSRSKAFTRVRSAAEPLQTANPAKVGVKRVREEANKAIGAPAARSNVLPQRAQILRAVSGPLRIESLQRAEQSSNTREAASLPGHIRRGGEPAAGRQAHSPGTDDSVALPRDCPRLPQRALLWRAGGAVWPVAVPQGDPALGSGCLRYELSLNTALGARQQQARCQRTKRLAGEADHLRHVRRAAAAAVSRVSNSRATWLFACGQPQGPPAGRRLAQPGKPLRLGRKRGGGQGELVPDATTHDLRRLGHLHVQRRALGLRRKEKRARKRTATSSTVIADAAQERQRVHRARRKGSGGGGSAARSRCLPMRRRKQRRRRYRIP